jgi:hypothetical protein
VTQPEGNNRQSLADCPRTLADLWDQPLEPLPTPTHMNTGFSPSVPGLFTLRLLFRKKLAVMDALDEQRGDAFA